MDQQVFIDQQVQKAVARKTIEFQQQIASLQEVIRQQNTSLIQCQSQLGRLTSSSLNSGVIVDLDPRTDPTRFEVGTEVVVIDKLSPYHNHTGLIIDSIESERGPGTVTVKLNDDQNTVHVFSIGGSSRQQIRPKSGGDGSSAIVLVGGVLWKVNGACELDLKIGDSVHVLSESKQIMSKATQYPYGPICRVVNANAPLGVEIEEKGERRVVQNPRSLDLNPGDRVAVDPAFSILIGKAGNDEQRKFTLTSDLNACWDDIGGLEVAKRQIRDGIELPRSNPELFTYYGVKRPKGFLLYGPPGNGKTLLAQAAASSLAQMHGSSASESGYLYIKSPELLTKWVGETERLIRDNFEFGRSHFDEHGYPAVHVYDEADALMPQRGSRRSSDVSDTIVPMFLGEMDGADVSETARNPIIFLISNRPDTLDPAITRPGRIGSHVKIDRPDKATTTDILKIHSKNIPFYKEEIRDQSLIVVTEDIFSKNRLLYRINNEYDFTMGDAISGAMIAGIVEKAKLLGLHRDLESGERTGISLDDFRKAVSEAFQQQRGINHTYDIADFCERHGLQVQKATVERCFGVA